MQKGGLSRRQVNVHFSMDRVVIFTIFALETFMQEIKKMVVINSFTTSGWTGVHPVSFVVVVPELSTTRVGRAD